MSRLLIQGAKRNIFACEDFLPSIKALQRKHGANCTRHLARASALVQQLASFGLLHSPDQFKQEGEGFWAIRAGRVRFYGWYQEEGFYLSHAIFKDQNKLAALDMARMKRNRAIVNKKGIV